MKTLFDTLENARKHKFLGPAPLEEHLKNGMGFIEVLNRLSFDSQVSHRLIDLGSGGGIPAFVIAEKFSHWSYLLVERKKKRAEFLSWAAENPIFGGNIEVFFGEAEKAARDEKFEGKADFVTARSFAPPPKTAECGCRFLKKGGFMIISEPPKTMDRWPKTGLIPLGFEKIETKQPDFGTFQALELRNFPDQRYPRRPGAINKKPLW